LTPFPLRCIRRLNCQFHSYEAVRVSPAAAEHRIVDLVWRNRDSFFAGREAIVRFLTAKWQRELDYALRKNLWAFTEDRIAVRFQYECHDVSG
jgi:uncharacterized protein